MSSRISNQNSTPLRSLLNECIPSLRTEWKWAFKQDSLSSQEQIERMGRAYADYLTLVDCFNDHRLWETAGARLRKRLETLMDRGEEVALLFREYKRQIEEQVAADSTTETARETLQEIRQILFHSNPREELAQIRKLAETEAKGWWLKAIAQGFAGG